MRGGRKGTLQQLVSLFLWLPWLSISIVNGWKLLVYTAAVNNVREKCEMEIKKDYIISRSKTLYKDHTFVFSHSGFGWDCENNKITVDSDDVRTTMYRQTMTLGDKFTTAFKTDVSEPPPKLACPEEMWAALASW